MPRSSSSQSLLFALARRALRRSQAVGAPSSSFSACATSSVSTSSPAAAGTRSGACWNSAAAARALVASRSSSASSALLFSTSSSSTSSTPSSDDKPHHHQDHLHLGDADGRAHINALLYRARQRGFLELDLLLGGWASRHAAALDAQGRAALEELLELENPDLFAWLTGQIPPPPEVSGNAAFRSIAADVAERLHRHRPEGAKSKKGAKWVRGWDDIKKEK